MNPVSRSSSRLATLVGAVLATGLAVVGLTIFRLAEGPPNARALISLAILLVFAAIAERYPVPVETIGVQGYSLSTVFVTAGIVLFGWEPLVVVAVVSLAAVDLWQRRDPLRVAYNASVFALSALAAGMLLVVLPGDRSLLELVAAVALVGIGFAGANLVLVSAAAALSDGHAVGRTIARALRWGAIPFALGLSASLMLVVLWQRSPLLIFALAGPLLAIDLYERQKHRAVSALRLAFTDPLTGLGNTRHFHERLQDSLDQAESTGNPLALCVFDLDNLKEVNDEFGHPMGDRVLVAVAGRLRHGGEAFRLGGDEFAVLLPGRSSEEALSVAESILKRVAAIKIDEGVPRSTMSSGVVSYPSDGVSRGDLMRLADSALYWAKNHGKNRVRVYYTQALSDYELERIAASSDLGARLRAAASLADAVDARDAHSGAHSRNVGELAARIGKRLGLGDGNIELLRLAGNLHDVGKLAIPEELLRKRGPLSDTEMIVLQRHPQIGYRMLESLALGQVAEWVLHHHERWDGMGYPSGLAAEAIPLGARIIFVADAWDSMTSETTYRSALSREQALAELEERAGSQFDPEVVQALATELGLIAVAV
jgi:diguanylate cyclase (GGDEF)-like protein